MKLQSFERSIYISIKVAVREFKLDICYSRNIEQRSKNCLVSAVFGTTGVFGDGEECLVCLEEDQEPKVFCRQCGRSRVHVHCSHGLPKCPNCRGDTSPAKSIKDTQFLLTQYQRCEGPHCSVSVLIELYNNDKQEMFRAVESFDQILEDTARTFHGYLHRDIACTACIMSTSSLLDMEDCQYGVIEEDHNGFNRKCKKCFSSVSNEDLKLVEDIKKFGNFRNFEDFTLKKKEDVFLDGALKITKSTRFHFKIRGRLCRNADFDQIVQHLKEKEKMVKKILMKTCQIALNLNCFRWLSDLLLSLNSRSIMMFFQRYQHV